MSKEERKFSGRTTLRMPIGLHRELENAAKAQRVSMNQLVCTVLAAELSWTTRPTRPSGDREEETEPDTDEWYANLMAEIGDFG